jgi:Uma2 family endonuclease
MSTAYFTFLGPPGVGPIVLPVKRLTNDQYLRMIAAGILDDDKVELIEGVITPMSPAGPDHNGSLYLLTDIFSKVIDRFVLAVQGTVLIAEGQIYEPDVALLRRKTEGYMRSLATADDVALIVESASSSFNKDRHLKLPIYAAAGIPEYWLVDLEQQRLLVFRDPRGGAYCTELVLSRDDTISPLACPDLTVPVSDIFG